MSCEIRARSRAQVSCLTGNKHVCGDHEEGPDKEEASLIELRQNDARARNHNKNPKDARREVDGRALIRQAFPVPCPTRAGRSAAKGTCDRCLCESRFVLRLGLALPSLKPTRKNDAKDNEDVAQREQRNKYIRVRAGPESRGHLSNARGEERSDGRVRPTSR